MKDDIKKIVDESNIKLMKVNEEAEFPRSKYSNTAMIEGIRKKLFEDVAAQIIPICDTDNFVSAETRENMIRITGEFVICSQRELMHVLEKVYEAGKVESFLTVTKPFENES